MARLIVLLLLLATPAGAQDALVTYKSLSPEVAADLARAALASCRERGFQVAVAVVDRFGVTQVLLRDRFAGAHSVATATGKAWTAVSFRTSTGELAAMTQPGMPQAGVRSLPGVVAIGGGLVVEAAGSVLGGVGISGAPGGDADEACATGNRGGAPTRSSSDRGRARGGANCREHGMNGDYSRLTFDPSRNYSGVRMQQGRVLLDSDWNEQAELLNRRARAAIIDTFGRLHVASAEAFAVSLGPGGLMIWPRPDLRRWLDRRKSRSRAPGLGPGAR